MGDILKNWTSIEYSGIVNECSRPIKIRSSQSVDFDSSQFQIVTKQLTNTRFFREQNNISAVPKQQF
jgi:hypothetical protein